MASDYILENYPNFFRWVDQCDGSHDCSDCRKADINRYPSSWGHVGQNTAYATSFDQAIQMWYDEVSNV